MAVWSDKSDGEVIYASHVNQLADGFSGDNSYNFGTDTPLKTFCTKHNAGGHTGGDGIAISGTPESIAVDLAATNPGLEFTGGKIQVKVDDSTIERAAGGIQVKDLGITTGKIASLAVTEGKIGSLAVTEGKIGSLAVTTGKIADAAVTADKLATAVAGPGLSGGGGSALEVNVDNSTIEISTDTLQVKDLGVGTAKIADDAVTAAKIAAAVAGPGLGGGGGSALQVNVDDASTEISSDQVIVKDTGITEAKLADGAVAKAKMANNVLSGKGTTGSRPAAAKAGYLYYNTDTCQLQRDTGAAWEALDLGGNMIEVVWTEATASDTDGDDAPALPEIGSIGEGNEIIRVRLAVQKTAAWNRLAFRGQYYGSGVGVNAGFLKIKESTDTATEVYCYTTVNGTWTDFDEGDLVIDCSPLTNGVTYEFQFKVKDNTSASWLDTRRMSCIIYLA